MTGSSFSRSGDVAFQTDLHVNRRTEEGILISPSNEDRQESPVPSRPRALTERQRNILNMIAETIDDTGYAPTIPEISQEIGIAYATVSSELSQLQRKHYIQRKPRSPRAIRLAVPRDQWMSPPAPPPPKPQGQATNIARAPMPIDSSSSELVSVPLFGRVAAGRGTFAVKDVESLFPFARDFIGHGEFFMLRVKGNSMIGDHILDGDYVVVRQQDTANNGDLVMALLSDNTSDPVGEATVKRLSIEKSQVLLKASNPQYGDIPADSATIQGKVIAIVRHMG